MVQNTAAKANINSSNPAGTLMYAASLPLSMVRVGESAVIRSIRGKDETRRFLESLGFVENVEVTVVSELGGNVIVSVKDARVAISRSMASRIITG